MTKILPIIAALENIYISPLESCNLNCRLCYTHKTKNVLTNQQILDFIQKYQSYLQKKSEDTIFEGLERASHIRQPKKCVSKNLLSLKSILFCGGEVFILPDFPKLVNQLIQDNLFITIITNGTMDRLDEIINPQNCQLLVSLDGPENIHDQNRGVGNFQKSIVFIKKALSLGFPTEIMFLVTPESYPYKDKLSMILEKLLSQRIPLNYITQKTIFYTDNHPLSNQNNKFPALSRDQIIDIKKNYNSVPSKNFGCFQLSLQSNGQIYGCCESPTPLGSLSSNINAIIDNFKKSLSFCGDCNLKSCDGCCNPDFFCGYKKELNLINCKDVVKSFN